MSPPPPEAHPGDGPGAWLVRGDDVLAALCVGAGRVVGRPDGPALVLRRATVVHTLGCAGVDVAWCRRLEGPPLPPAAAPGLAWEVARTRTLAAHRAVLAHARRGAVVVAPAGAFERWGLRVGDRVGVACP